MKQKIKDRLIDDRRQYWRFWSVRLTGLGLTIGAIVQAAPDFALQTWLMLPDEVKSLLPEQYLRWVSLGLVASGMIARLFKQKDKSNVE